MNIESLREELGKTNDQAQKIYLKAKGEERDLELVEAEELDALLKQADNIKKQIANAERIQAVQNLGTYITTAIKPKVAPPQPGAMLDQGPTATYQPDTPKAQPRIQMRMHHGGLRVFNKGERDLEAAYGVGRFFDAIFNRNAKSMQWCRDQGMILDAHLENVDTSGGLFVPEEMSARIIDLRDQYGVFRSNTYLEPMGSASKVVPRRKSGLTAYHVGEAASTTSAGKASSIFHKSSLFSITQLRVSGVNCSQTISIAT